MGDGCVRRGMREVSMKTCVWCRGWCSNAIGSARVGSVDAKVLVVPCFSQCLRLFLCGYASSSVVGGVLIRCTSHGAPWREGRS